MAPKPESVQGSGPFLVVLGVAQDGSYPQAGCNRPHCLPGWEDDSRRRHATSLAIVDPKSKKRWLLDATPDFPEQLRMLDQLAAPPSSPGIDGILLTHAHIGHYLGLAYLGREVIGARSIPVYAMPRMRGFLETNGPWSQLVKLRNIELQALEDRVTVRLSPQLTVTPFTVPHRDEYSETIGYRIVGAERRVAFIPDIDKWERWNTPIETLLEEVDIAYLDGTFFQDGEIAGRSMSEIPHPFIRESMRRFRDLPAKIKKKVRFIHLNHTNPALQLDSAERKEVESAGFRIADEGEIVPL